MKAIFLSIGIALIAATTGFVNEALPIGSKLPKADVKMLDISGKKISMAEAAKKNGLLVMFSCNTCPYVIKNEQRTTTISVFAAKNNVGVILINSNEAQRGDDDSYEAMKAYAKGLNYNWPYVIDENNVIADAFDAKRTPEVFLFDSNMTLVYHGAIDDNPTDEMSVTRQHLREAIKEMVAGKEVGIKESKSIGCTIKRKKG
ncbi:MAG: thioredoxin family protein [Chitinophagaceae bacterium]|nr:MAG: thioredoxin family protein [Chitinophagaceae bacterium]